MDKKLFAFTLIELLVVIAIIGILSGLIIVTMNGVTQKANIAKAQIFSNSLRNSLMMNLVSDWNFDATGVTDGSSVTVSYLLDVWGQKNGAVTATPPTVLSGSNCVSGSCLNFNGSQYVSIADDSVFDFGNQMTAMVWVKGSSIGVFQGIFGQFNETANKRSWMIYHHSSYPGKLTVYLSDDGTSDIVHRKMYYTSTNIIDGNWHLAGFVWNNGTLKLYVDGVELTANKAVDGTITTLYNSDANITVGCYLVGSPSYYFTGQIDGARLYNSAIPTSQIKEQYYAGLNNLFINGEITQEEYISQIKEVAQR